MEPKIAQKAPVAVEVEAGTAIYWCTCGLNASGHIAMEATRDRSSLPGLYPENERNHYLCANKYTKKAPLCDGAHKSL